MLFKKNFWLIIFASAFYVYYLSGDTQTQVEKQNPSNQTQAQINNQESTEDFVYSYIDALTSQNIVPKEKITYKDGKLTLYADPSKLQTFLLQFASLMMIGMGAGCAYYLIIKENKKISIWYKLFVGLISACMAGSGIYVGKIAIDRIHRTLNNVPFLIFEEEGLTLCDKDKKILWKDIYRIRYFDTINDFGQTIRTDFQFSDSLGNIIIRFCSTDFLSIPKENLIRLIEFYWSKKYAY